MPKEKLVRQCHPNQRTRLEHRDIFSGLFHDLNYLTGHVRDCVQADSALGCFQVAPSLGIEQ